MDEASNQELKYLPPMSSSNRRNLRTALWHRLVAEIRRRKLRKRIRDSNGVKERCRADFGPGSNGNLRTGREIEEVLRSRNSQYQPSLFKSAAHRSYFSKKVSRPRLH